MNIVLETVVVVSFLSFAMKRSAHFVAIVSLVLASTSEARNILMRR